MNTFQNLPPDQMVMAVAITVLAFCVCIPQGIWLFYDAQKRGRFPWLWGLWGLITFPMPIIFYYFFIIRPSKKQGRP